jgi:hypothetical protein
MTLARMLRLHVAAAELVAGGIPSFTPFARSNKWLKMSLDPGVSHLPGLSIWGQVTDCRPNNEPKASGCKSKAFQCCGFEECCPAAVSIYLLTDRGSRVVGITILAGRRLDNLRSAGVTTGLGSGIGTSATASGSRTSHWHIL